MSKIPKKQGGKYEKASQIPSWRVKICEEENNMNFFDFVTVFPFSAKENEIFVESEPFFLIFF